MKKLLLLVAFALVGTLSAGENAEKTLVLPAPAKTGGLPLNEALANRHSSRDFAAGKEFTLQQLSDLLWAASGINREDGRMTAPTASNSQEIDLYVALPAGVYFYNRAGNTLDLLVAGDVRKATGGQPFVGQGTVEIILVADLDKLKGADAQRRDMAYIDSGYVSQNLYLFAASANLNSVVRAWVPREALAQTLGLNANQIITVVQTVGFPK
ncbi:MAG: SagB/ThcOx family dehydrogenase [Planctomycetota bacterium]|jgi:nitroreductase|nr:SagB/ThcOx family dehydrogenase [Planctomycetota bacterium]